MLCNLQSKKRYSQIMVIGVILIVFVISHFITGGRLLTFSNMKTIFIQCTYPLIIALGMTFIFSGGLVDLSIGAQVILAANVGAVLVEDYGLGYPGLIIGILLSIVICELLSASCSIFLNIPSWVAGLGAALVFEAVTTIYVTKRAKTAGTSIVYLKNCRALGQFPWILIVAVLVFLVAYLIFNHTNLGFQLRAVGGNAEVAEAMGINRKKTILKAVIIGALIIGVGTMTQLSYTGRFTATSGLGSLSGIFKALATVLISGSFARIFSEPVGVAIGAFIITGLFNILTLLGVPSGTGQEMCLGAVVILCGILSSFRYKGVVK